MENKTLVTIDFDGCISPIDHSKDFREEPGFSVMKLAGFFCAVRDESIEFLNALQNAQKARGLWASSWEDHLLALHKDSDGRIPEIPWLPVSSSRKKSIFHHAVEENYRKVVIIEDSATVNRNLRKLFEEWNLNNPSIDYLIIQPKTETGLTSKQIKRIWKFINC